MATCSKCGTRLPEGANFCPVCGSPVRGSTVARSTGVVNVNKERQEAIDAGERALDSLNRARYELNRARNWGIADLLGGGLIASMVKRSKMSDAQRYLEAAKRDMHVFSRELSDVAGVMFLEIDTEDFLSFADVIFDNFAVDFLVQEKINRALQKVNEAISRVDQILRQLKKG